MKHYSQKTTKNTWTVQFVFQNPNLKLVWAATAQSV